MRLALAALLVVAMYGSAVADAKITSLTKFYEKEGGTCKKNLRGVTVVVERGKPVAGKDPELAADIAELEKAQATIDAQCTELAAMVEFLKSNSSGTYKQIETDFGEREKKIRAGRVTSKQAIDGAQPLISRAVPRINKLIAQAAADAQLSTREKKVEAEKALKAEKAAADKAAADKAAADKVAADKAAAEKKAAEKVAAKPEPKPLTKFPSGRGIELPAPTEGWTLSGTADVDIADYAFAGAKATLTVRAHGGAPSCDQIRTSLQLTGSGRGPQAAEMSAELKTIKPAWKLAWSEGDRQVTVVCVASKQGVIVGRSEAGLAGNAPLDLALSRMVGARLKR